MSIKSSFHRLCREGNYSQALTVYDQIQDLEMFNCLCLRTTSAITYPFGAAIASDNVKLVQWFVNKSNQENLPLAKSNHLNFHDFISHAALVVSLNAFDYLCQVSNYDGISLLMSGLSEIKDIEALIKIYNYISSKGKIDLLWRKSTIMTLMKSHKLHFVNWLWDQIKSLPSDCEEEDLYNFFNKNVIYHQRNLTDYCLLLNKLLRKVAKIEKIGNLEIAIQLMESESDLSFCQKIIESLDSTILSDVMAGLLYKPSGLLVNKLIFNRIIEDDLKVNLHFNYDILFIYACSVEDYDFAKQIISYCQKYPDLGLVNITVGKVPIFINVCKKGNLDFVKYLISLKDCGHADVLSGINFESLKKLCKKEIIDYLEPHFKKPEKVSMNNEIDQLKQDIAFLKNEMIEMRSIMKRFNISG